MEAQPAHPAVAALEKDLTPPENVSCAILGVQKALDQLQAKQFVLRKQLLFYWIELQLLQWQGLLCSETHEALACGEREVAEAILHLPQYYGRSSTS